MQAVVTRPDTIVRAGLTVLIAGLMLLGLMVLNSPAVSATSLIASTNVAVDEEAEADQLSTLIAQEPFLTSSRIAFLEDNVALPGYEAAPISDDHTANPVENDLALPWSEDQAAY